MNSQNCRIRSAENPHAMHETPLYDEKIGVWCAISRSRIIGPIFFTETINSDCYIKDVLKPFLTKLSDTEKRIGYFQQDVATAHTSNASLTILQTIFGSSIISKNLLILHLQTFTYGAL